MSKEEMPFEKALERLEEIVEILEAGKLGLEESLALFAEGVSLSRYCSQKLAEAERKVEMLLEDASGEVEVRPFAIGEDGQ